jgi:tRNA threonylcarbamoyl adenosine modification protein YeaZ
MKILALELSSAQGSIAWREKGRELGSTEFPNDRKHSGLFFENLERSLAQFGKPDRIVVGLGPGSYAGTRIAIATATGLAVATDAELLGLPSVCAIATDATEYTVVGDARRQSFYFAHISARRCSQGPLLCSEIELRDRIEHLSLPIFSTEPLPTFSNVTLAYPSAGILAQIAAADTSDAVRAPFEPIYLREPYITQPRALA